ncbi:MAG: hypothetical protein ACTSX0_14590, partial [Promethearchaeota archaeon]
MKNFVKIAQELLDLEEFSAGCYELLLIKGKLTVGEICAYKKLDEESEYNHVLEVLNNLVAKGLAQKIPKAKGLIDVYIGIAPFEGFTIKLHELSSQMMKNRKYVEKGIEELRDTTKTTIDTVKNDIEGILGEKAQEIKDLSQKQAENISSAVESTISELESRKNSHISAIQSNMAKSKADLEESLTKLTQDSLGAIEKTQTETIQFTEENKNSLINGIKEKDGIMQAHFEEEKNNYQESLQGTSESIIKLHSINVNKISENVDLWHQQILTSLDKMEQDTIIFTDKFEKEAINTLE